MNDRGSIFLTALLLTLVAGVSSCERVIALDKGVEKAEGSVTNKQSGDEALAGGNPAENIAEGPASPPGEFAGDATAASDSDTVAPAADESWFDNGTDTEDAFSDSGTTPDEDLPSSFSIADCACGESPIYAPVCCDGTTTVFNKCFANCLNYYTGQCAAQQEGTCTKRGNDTATDDDNLSETSDDDTLLTTECGCIPTDINAWCCDGSGRYIGKCTALCNCEDIPTPCR